MPATLEPFYRGKVRDLYEVDEERMVISASDRISAFDVVFDRPFPGKGIILNGVSGLWFRALRTSGLLEKHHFTDHMLSDAVDEYPEPFRGREEFRGRSMLVRRTKRVDFECVVRGYIVGSGWKDYQRTGTICGHRLPAGLRLADRLPEPIFTPATKAPLGQHDENVDLADMERAVGAGLTTSLKEISFGIYRFASERLAREGILLADTKFEFGTLGGKIVLIDEALTPDSSRYWDAAEYRPGVSPPSFDKQIVRDYLETLDWNKQSPGPQLPDAVVDRAMARYRELEIRVRRALSVA